ncbi:MAG TPA: 4-hydroxythreonine-4-phosphate dehydrogenase PdxA [Geobacteraceae bacterium]|nr:4-hydroxythreonine-4-phosphate dehydrogenase PdxA [Geobacteraceae bacterium]
MNKPVIAVTMGDPCGIGPEIIAKSLADDSVWECCLPVVVGDLKAMERAVALTGCGLSTAPVSNDAWPDLHSSRAVHVVQTGSLCAIDMQYGQPTIATGKAVYDYITTAANFCLSGRVAAMATAPISKEVLNRAGYNYPGHTELLAELTGTPEFVMMLAGDKLRVTLVTIHEALAAVPSLLTIEKVLTTIRITHKDIDRYFKRDPKIAVLALNPHCGEGGLFGSEEVEIITPAIEMARSFGVDVHGPLSADTLFYFAVRGDYDAVVCMYHDQGLIPLKLLHFDDGVNITLGLPLIRTSVDHGTAYGIAGRGSASAASMTSAIKTAAHMAACKIDG